MFIGIGTFMFVGIGTFNVCWYIVLVLLMFVGIDNSDVFLVLVMFS